MVEERAGGAAGARRPAGGGYGLTGHARARGAARRHAERRARRATDSGCELSAAGVIRVMLADDQRVVREGLVTLLGLLDGIEVVGAAADGEEAVELAPQHSPDVVLMDLRMPRSTASRRPAGCRERAGDARRRADDLRRRRLRPRRAAAGARGYLTKDAGADEIRAAVEAVERGEAALDPTVQRQRRGGARRGRRRAGAAASRSCPTS